MDNNLKQLIDIQQRDLILDEMFQASAEYPVSIEKRQKKLERAKEQIKAAKNSFTSLQLKKKQLELDAETQQKLVQKHQNELNSLKSNDAYKSMLAEIEAAKEKVIQIEDEILGLMEKLEGVEKEAKEADKKMREEEIVAQADIQRIELEKKAMDERWQEKKKERDAFARALPPPLLSQYESLRSSLKGVAIAIMAGNACSECRMALPPAQVGMIKASKSIAYCDNCQRILIYQPEEAAPAS